MTTHLDSMRTLGRAMLVLGAVAALAACNTPQAALDQANHTTKLMSQLEIQLEQFRAVTSAAEQARLAMIENQRQVLARQQMSAKLQDIVKKSAGDTVEGPAREKLLAAADFIAGYDSSLDRSHKADQERLGGLLAPLPSTAASMNASQVAAAKMGTELPLNTRLNELAAAAKDIKGSVAQDVDKLKQAKANAAAATEETETATTKEAAAPLRGK